MAPVIKINDLKFELKGLSTHMNGFYECYFKILVHLGSVLVHLYYLLN